MWGSIIGKRTSKSLKNMSNNKSPGNDDLTEEFYDTFWEDLKKPLWASIRKAFHRGKLTQSQETSRYKSYRKKT